MATWDSSLNDWVNPTLLPYPVNTNGDEFTARISPDGNHLYFTSTGPPDSLFPSGRDGLYVSERNGNSWSVPVSLGPIVNASGTEEYPSITADGRWLYFRRFVTDGTSSFVSGWTQSGWSVAVDLRPQIGARSGSPCIVPSGDTLFFRTSELTGLGASDIWLMERKIPPRVPALEKWSLFALVLFLLLSGALWIKRGKLITH